MKKIIFITIVLFYSCSLDLPVEDEITGIDAIDELLTAQEALSSIYLSYPKNRILFSKLADDFYPNHTISDNPFDYNLYRWNTQELLFESNALWADYYKTISKANLLINSVDNIQTNNTDEKAQLDFIHAQALSLKALSYLNLIEIYAPAYSSESRDKDGIILKNDINSEEISRASLEISLAETEQLLLKAIDLFSDSNSTTFRINKSSATASLAKLYLMWQKYDEAITLCDTLLSNNLNLESFTNLWRTPENNPEVLLAFENRTFNYSAIFDPSFQEYEYYLNFNIQFTNNDYRKDISYFTEDFTLLNNSVIQANFIAKYYSSNPNISVENAAPIAYIRTAELYFIKAEAAAKNNNNTLALNTLNAFLTLRNADQITNPTDLIQEILKEKQREFFGEGLRYFDLKRNNLDIIKVTFRNNSNETTISSDDFRWLLPIPLEEITNNSKAKQNPEWESII